MVAAMEVDLIAIEGIVLGVLRHLDGITKMNRDYPWLAAPADGPVRQCETRKVAISHLIEQKARQWKKEHCS